VRRRRSPWQPQRCGWRILAAFRAWPNPWHNKTVGPLPQTGVIGFKSTGSATRHTSTQDRPASDVSLSPTVPRFTSETDPLAEREGFEHSVPERNHLLPAGVFFRSRWRVRNSRRLCRHDQEAAITPVYQPTNRCLATARSNRLSSPSAEILDMPARVGIKAKGAGDRRRSLAWEEEQAWTIY
jgi:hypothetical protein